MRELFCKFLRQRLYLKRNDREGLFVADFFLASKSHHNTLCAVRAAEKSVACVRKISPYLVKERLLGVPHDTLENFGAVSAETAQAMAAGACRNLGTDASIAVTGIAGPGGGTPEKPVGLVYVGVCFKGKVNVIELRLRGTRSAVRERTRACALLELFKAVSGEDTECWV